MSGSVNLSRLERRDRELGVLYRISQATVNQHDISALLNEVLDIMDTEFGLSRGTLTLKRVDEDIFYIEASRGLTEEERRRGKYRIGEGITGKVAESGRSAIVPDISKDDSFLNLTRTRSGERAAFLCAPIVHGGVTIGTISIDQPSATSGELQHALKFLELVAGLLAEAVARIREDIEERDSLRAENRLLKQQLDDRYHPNNLVGKCSVMRQVYEQIAQVATSTATVLVRGESGTGKELVAKAIHHGSDRKNNAFVAVNCAALPEQLIESELFGHEKGAFTGAGQQRPGRFELANGGTIFLDEIGDISASVQVRLLRVLQERSFERVGGTETLNVNVRVIAATSRDLEAAMTKNEFREDLYYRLNVFPIHLPPLRERRSDIILLADHLLQKYNQIYNKNMRRISTTAINMMMAYHWPGNVRELENCIERAVIASSDDVLHGYSLPPSLQTSEQTNTALVPDSGASLKSMVDAYERELIVDALKKHRGNAAATARHLQTTQRVMNYKIKSLGIQARQYK